DNVNEEKLLTITEPVEILGSYKTQYLFTFDQTGLDNSASGTILLVDGESKAYNDLPDTDWFDGGTTYMYSSIISVGNGKRFVLTNPVGTLTITGTGSANGVYEKQFLFKVFSPVEPGATGEGWYKDGVTVSSSKHSPFIVVGPPKIEYTSLGYVGTGSAPNGDETTVEFVIDEPSSITWVWMGKVILYPDGTVEEKIPISVGSDDHWRCVSDPNALDDNAYVSSSDFTGVKPQEWVIDYYSLQNTGLISGSIDKVTVFTKGTSSIGQADIRNILRLGGDTRQNEYGLSINWEVYGYTANRPGGGSWTWEDVDNLQAGVGLKLYSDVEAKCTLVWVEIEFTV
ncbi:hypothetical protein MUO66_08350, partial [Candidatus Bathyarchaeota archaeon]|nr:hypothetical protein [Candidatus Bathyarchaeota archaeon]